MKKIFYLAACTLFCMNIHAQSYWGEGQEANFERWIDVKDGGGNVTGERPYGWHAPYNSNWATGSNSVGVKFEAVDDRNGTARAACKVTTTGIASTWFTWHVEMRDMHWAANEDYNPILIDQGDDFFYTFWAKADVEGTKMWIGAAANYDPASGKLGWENVPSVELTTSWKQYGFVDFALITLTGFNIQLRSNAVRYIDDIQLEYGNELPPLDPGTGIFEIATNQNPISWISSVNGIAVNSLEGKVSVYDIMGKQIVAAKDVREGNNFIPIEGKGLHILKFQQGNIEKSIKVLVK